MSGEYSAIKRIEDRLNASIKMLQKSIEYDPPQTVITEPTKEIKSLIDKAIEYCLTEGYIEENQRDTLNSELQTFFESDFFQSINSFLKNSAIGKMLNGLMLPNIIPIYQKFQQLKNAKKGGQSA